MLGDISYEDTNEIIAMFSKSIRGNFLTRNIIESEIIIYN